MTRGISIGVQSRQNLFQGRCLTSLVAVAVPTVKWVLTILEIICFDVDNSRTSVTWWALQRVWRFKAKPCHFFCDILHILLQLLGQYMKRNNLVCMSISFKESVSFLLKLNHRCRFVTGFYRYSLWILNSTVLALLTVSTIPCRLSFIASTTIVYPGNL